MSDRQYAGFLVVTNVCVLTVMLLVERHPLITALATALVACAVWNVALSALNLARAAWWAARLHHSR